VSQYLGWVGIKLAKFDATLELIRQKSFSRRIGGEVVEEASSPPPPSAPPSSMSSEQEIGQLVTAASKLAYHALSKLFEVNRILQFSPPASCEIIHNEIVDLLALILNYINESFFLSSLFQTTSHHFPYLEKMISTNGKREVLAVAATDAKNDNICIGEPTVEFHGLEKDFILMIRCMNSWLITKETVDSSSSSSSSLSNDDDDVKQEEEMLSFVLYCFTIISNFTNKHLARLSDLNHSDKKHRISKKTRKLANKKKREESQATTTTTIDQGSSDGDVGDGDGGGLMDDTPLSDNKGQVLSEMVDWPVVAEWLLNLRMKQLYNERRSVDRK
jgi:hypothetical protein